MKLFRSAAVGWRTAIAASAVLAAISTAAWAAGYFPYFPVAGGTAYCSSASGTGSGTGSSTFPSSGPGSSFGQGSVGQSGVFTLTCNDQVPAGPSPSAPGTSFIPADTGLPSGQQPQTILIPAVMTGATTQDAAPLTGTTVTVSNGVARLLLDPAAGIAALTVQLPPATALFDGEEIQITSSQTVTTLTIVQGTGTTIVPSITTVTAAAPVTLLYHAATAKWVSG